MCPNLYIKGDLKDMRSSEPSNPNWDPRTYVGEGEKVNPHKLSSSLHTYIHTCTHMHAHMQTHECMHARTHACAHTLGGTGEVAQSQEHCCSEGPQAQRSHHGSG